MWFEVDGHALLVRAPDPSLQAALALIALPLKRCHAHLPQIGALSMRICTRQELRARVGEVAAAEGQRLQLPAVAEDGLSAEMLIRPTGADILCPGFGIASLSFDQAQAEVIVVDPGGLPAGILAASAVQAMIAERGWSPVHASLVEHEGRGVMFCGERSRGKTSSCLALLRSGWTMRADDRCFLRVREGLAVVWGPGGEMRLRPDAADLWPDLAPMVARGLPARGGKRCVRPDAIGGSASGGSVIHPTLFFPEVVGSGPHELVPMPRADALRELLVSAGLAALPVHAARQFRDLTVLVEQSACYHLRLGAAMDELPGVIAGVLA